MDILYNRIFCDRDERRPFRDPSLYTADSEDEDEKKRTIMTEEPKSQEADGHADTQKPLNSMSIFFLN